MSLLIHRMLSPLFYPTQMLVFSGWPQHPRYTAHPKAVIGKSNTPPYPLCKTVNVMSFAAYHTLWLQSIDRKEKKSALGTNYHRVQVPAPPWKHLHSGPLLPTSWVPHGRPEGVGIPRPLFSLQHVKLSALIVQAISICTILHTLGAMFHTVWLKKKIQSISQWKV